MCTQVCYCILPVVFLWLFSVQLCYCKEKNIESSFGWLQNQHAIVHPCWEDCKNNVNNFVVVHGIKMQPVPIDCPQKCAYCTYKLSVRALGNYSNWKSMYYQRFTFVLFCVPDFVSTFSDVVIVFGHVNVVNSIVQTFFSMLTDYNWRML